MRDESAQVRGADDGWQRRIADNGRRRAVTNGSKVIRSHFNTSSLKRCVIGN